MRPPGSLRFYLTAACAAALPGCAGDKAPIAVPARPVVIAPPAAAAIAPAVYMAVAANTSLFAVRASALAAERASDPGLRAAASQVLANQGGVGGQLSHAGRRVNLLPDAALPQPLAADLERLRATPDFDREYRRVVGQALARALAIHTAYERSGTSPTLRMVARMAAPLTRRDLEALRR